MLRPGARRLKKRMFKKILFGTSIGTILLMLVAGVFMIMVVGMYQTLIAAVVAQEDSVRARSGNLLGSEDEIGVIDHALSYIGTPYEHGGDSYVTIDCSGLIMVSYKRAGTGIELPHASYEQAKLGSCIYRQDPDWTVLVSPTADMRSGEQSFGEYTVYVFDSLNSSYVPLEPGDVICFAYGTAVEQGYPVGHVGLYIGNGWFVHSLNETLRTFISPIYDIEGDFIFLRPKIYTVRRFLDGQEQDYVNSFMGFDSDLVGHPIMVPYQHVERLAQYLYENTNDLMARERYQAAIDIINQARTDQTSISEVITQLGGVEGCAPDVEAWRITRCALIGHYFYPADGPVGIAAN